METFWSSDMGHSFYCNSLNTIHLLVWCLTFPSQLYWDRLLFAFNNLICSGFTEPLTHMRRITMTLFLLLRCQHGIENRYMNLSNPSTWQAVASDQTGQVCQGNYGAGERNSTSGRWNLKWVWKSKANLPNVWSPPGGTEGWEEKVLNPLATTLPKPLKQNQSKPSVLDMLQIWPLQKEVFSKNDHQRKISITHVCNLMNKINWWPK